MSEPEDYFVEGAIEAYEQSIADMICDKDYIEERIFIDNCRKVVEMYSVENLIDSPDKLYSLTFYEEIKICKKLLEPIEGDIMPVIRQVAVFENLINLEWPEYDKRYITHGNITRYAYNYFSILACAFIDDMEDKNSNLYINPLIPKKHYTKTMDKIYRNKNIDTLQIPLGDETRYLIDLFEIWIKYKVDKKNYYSIALEHTEIVQPIQVQRKIKSISKLHKENQNKKIT